MATSFGALCTDFYINHKLVVKMDLPYERETVLHFFEAVGKSEPAMDRFRKHDGELALESGKAERAYQWLSMGQTHIRTGYVNPDTMGQAGALHQLILKIAPYHLTISPIDVDYQEVMFGFDLECKGNHDAVIYDALFDGTPLGGLLRQDDAKVLDVQPSLGMSLADEDHGAMQVYFEIKTRTKNRRGNAARYKHEPISLFLTVRKYGPLKNVEELIDNYLLLVGKAEQLAADRLVPHVLTPITRYITSGSA